jgi:O-methyltransferase involved in polyketide biosynthesis
MQVGEPSHTARGAAAYRAIHQTLEGGVIFSDPFASKILDDETRARPDETAAGDLPVGRLLDRAVESFFRIFRKIFVAT